jgi:hypothetical protein
VKFHEAIATYAYPVKLEGRYVMVPSPIPKFDIPNTDTVRHCSHGQRSSQFVVALSRNCNSAVTSACYASVDGEKVFGRVSY